MSQTEKKIISQQYSLSKKKQIKRSIVTSNFKQMQEENNPYKNLVLQNLKKPIRSANLSSARRSIDVILQNSAPKKIFTPNKKPQVLYQQNSKLQELITLVSYTVSSADQIIEKVRLINNNQLDKFCKLYQNQRDILGQFVQELVLNDTLCGNLSAELGEIPSFKTITSKCKPTGNQQMPTTKFLKSKDQSNIEQLNNQNYRLAQLLKKLFEGPQIELYLSQVREEAIMKDLIRKFQETHAKMEASSHLQVNKNVNCLEKKINKMQKDLMFKVRQAFVSCQRNEAISIQFQRLRQTILRRIVPKLGIQYRLDNISPCEILEDYIGKIELNQSFDKSSRKKSGSYIQQQQEIKNLKDKIQKLHYQLNKQKSQNFENTYALSPQKAAQTNGKPNPLLSRINILSDQNQQIKNQLVNAKKQIQAKQMMIAKFKDQLDSTKTNMQKEEEKYLQLVKTLQIELRNLKNSQKNRSKIYSSKQKFSDRVIKHKHQGTKNGLSTPQSKRQQYSQYQSQKLVEMQEKIIHLNKKLELKTKQLTNSIGKSSSRIAEIQKKGRDREFELLQNIKQKEDKVIQIKKQYLTKEVEFTRITNQLNAKNIQLQKKLDQNLFAKQKFTFEKQQQIAQKTKELIAQIKSQQSQIEKLKFNTQKIQFELEKKYSLELYAKQSKIIDLSYKCNQLSTNLKDITQKYQTLKAQIIIKNGQNQSIERQKQTQIKLRKKIYELQEQVSTIQKIKVQFNATLKQKAQTCQALQKALQEAHTEYANQIQKMALKLELEKHQGTEKMKVNQECQLQNIEQLKNIKSQLVAQKQQYMKQLERVKAQLQIEREKNIQYTELIGKAKAQQQLLEENKRQYIRQFQSIKEQLECSIQSMKQTNQQQKQSHEKINRILQEKLSQKQLIIHQLEQQLVTKKRQLCESQRIYTLKLEQATKTTELDYLRNTQKKLKEQNQHLQSKISQLIEQISPSKNKSNPEKISKIQKIETQLHNEKQKNEQLNEKVKKLMLQLQKKEREKSYLMNQFTDEIEKIKDEQKKKEDQIDYDREQFYKELENLKNLTKEKNKIISDLQQNLIMYRQMNNYRQQFERPERRLSQPLSIQDKQAKLYLDVKIKDLKSQMLVKSQELQKTNKKVEDDIEHIRNWQNTYSQQFSRVNKSNQQTIKLLTQKIQKVEQNFVQAQMNYRQNISKLQFSSLNLKGQIKKMETQTKQFEQQIQKLKIEKQQLLSKIQELEKQKNTAQNQILAFGKKIQKMKLDEQNYQNDLRIIKELLDLQRKKSELEQHQLLQQLKSLEEKQKQSPRAMSQWSLGQPISPQLQNHQQHKYFQDKIRLRKEIEERNALLQFDDDNLGFKKINSQLRSDKYLNLHDITSVIKDQLVESYIRLSLPSVYSPQKHTPVEVVNHRNEALKYKQLYQNLKLQSTLYQEALRQKQQQIKNLEKQLKKQKQKLQQKEGEISSLRLQITELNRQGTQTNQCTADEATLLKIVKFKESLQMILKEMEKKIERYEKMLVQKNQKIIFMNQQIDLIKRYILDIFLAYNHSQTRQTAMKKTLIELIHNVKKNVQHTTEMFQEPADNLLLKAIPSNYLGQNSNDMSQRSDTSDHEFQPNLKSQNMDSLSVSNKKYYDSMRNSERIPPMRAKSNTTISPMKPPKKNKKQINQFINIVKKTHQQEKIKLQKELKQNNLEASIMLNRNNSHNAQGSTNKVSPTGEGQLAGLLQNVCHDDREQHDQNVQSPLFRKIGSKRKIIQLASGENIINLLENNTLQQIAQSQQVSIVKKTSLQGVSEQKQQMEEDYLNEDDDKITQNFMRLSSRNIKQQIDTNFHVRKQLPADLKYSDQLLDRTSKKDNEMRIVLCPPKAEGNKKQALQRSQTYLKDSHGSYNKCTRSQILFS